MDPSIDLRLAELARGQYGHLSRAQLRDAGVSPSTVFRRVRQGLLVPAGHSTFRLAGVAPTAHGRVAAACLDTGGVASHWTAAWLHGLLTRLIRMDVTVRRRRSVWEPDGAVRVHTSTNLPADDVLVVDGIRTTSVARTLMMLGALVPDELTDERLYELVSEALERRLATEPWLWWTLSQRRCRGRDGVIAFEDALARRARLGPTESWLEREVLRLLDGAGLPLPRLQRVVRRQGRLAARVDFSYDAEGIVVEALGYAYHRGREALRRDTERANELALQGLTVLQLTWDQVTCDPASVPRTVGRALRAAGRDLAA